MAATSVTETYNAVLSTTLRNYLPKAVVDNMSQGRYLRFVMNGTKSNPKPKNGGYETLSTLGERCQVPLMLGQSQVDTYAGWQPVSVTPTEGITSAFYQWRQMGGSIVINGLEQEQNKGENAIVNLLQAKADQTKISLVDFANKVTIAGNADNGNALTQYVSTANASTGPDPLGFLVAKDGLNTVGSVDSSIETNWKNQFLSATASNFATLEIDLDNLFISCAVAVGGEGEPDFHLTDPQLFNEYRASLRSHSRIDGYTFADLPFENVAFRGGPVFYDKFVPDANAGTTPGLGGASSTRAKGTWYMLNSRYIKIYASKANNFTPGDFVKAIDQDGIASKVLWYGAQTLSNRAKHGVYFNVALNLTS